MMKKVSLLAVMVFCAHGGPIKKPSASGWQKESGVRNRWLKLENHTNTSKAEKLSLRQNVRGFFSNRSHHKNPYKKI
jgi:hypothetical protein